MKSIRATQRWVALMCLLVGGAGVEAQMFGRPRTLGSPLTRQSRPGQSTISDPEGEVRADSRFLRGNRGRGDFVGSDRGDVRGFVGSQQGRVSGPVVSAVAGVGPDVDRSTQINQSLRPPRRTELYPPKIVLGFASATAPGLRDRDALLGELANPDYFAASNRYEVWVEGRTAILRGEVADARERDLAALLVSFEPGISAVRNELTIAKPGYAASTPVPPSTRRPSPTNPAER